LVSPYYIEDDPIGEIYSPGFDCSKILDSNPEAKDGLYYIDLGGFNAIQVRDALFKVKQVLCHKNNSSHGFLSSLRYIVT
jgi:hypothetical protein